MKKSTLMRGATRVAMLWLAIVAPAAGQGAPFKILHAFGAAGDAVSPSSGIVFDKHGDFYGETIAGGNLSCGNGCGAVYELSPQKDGSWAETLIYNFGSGGIDDALYPVGGLAMDGSGDLFGVTQMGGANNRGAAFELTPADGGWTETVLYSFCSLPNCADGADPSSAPVLDSSGTLYGTTFGHGAVAYKLSPGSSGWTETVLYTFCSQSGCTDGDFPDALVRDAMGNLYGAAEKGGVADGGVIFTLRPKQTGGWAYAKLYDFTSDGAPDAINLHNGALYGNTVGCEVGQCGTLFQLMASGGKIQRSLLYVFNNSNDGAIPEGNLAFDSSGNMYGGTGQGGSGCGVGCGVVFQLIPGNGGSWQYQSLHDFSGNDGQLPQYGVIEHNGHLFGTTLGGGAPYYGGVVFEITP